MPRLTYRHPMPDLQPNWPDRLQRAALSTLGEESPAHLGSIAARHTSQFPIARFLAIAIGTQTEPPGREPKSLDEHLWAAVAGHGEKPTAPESPTGPITGAYEAGAIEVWTETELACVHAAWSLGSKWQDAARRSARWLLENIQPDNATNHPWAVHVFATLAAEADDIEFDLYAQTLLHNCVVSQGQPDVFSALILLHASRAIQAG
jgi:hypothetical protein